jgi:hypothetical protein
MSSVHGRITHNILTGMVHLRSVSSLGSNHFEVLGATVVQLPSGPRGRRVFRLRASSSSAGSLKECRQHAATSSDCDRQSLSCSCNRAALTTALELLARQLRPERRGSKPRSQSPPRSSAVSTPLAEYPRAANSSCRAPAVLLAARPELGRTNRHTRSLAHAGGVRAAGRGGFLLAGGKRSGYPVWRAARAARSAAARCQRRATLDAAANGSRSLRRRMAAVLVERAGRTRSMCEDGSRRFQSCQRSGELDALCRALRTDIARSPAGCGIPDMSRQRWPTSSSAD